MFHERCPQCRQGDRCFLQSEASRAVQRTKGHSKRCDVHSTYRALQCGAAAQPGACRGVSVIIGTHLSPRTQQQRIKLLRAFLAVHSTHQGTPKPPVSERLIATSDPCMKALPSQPGAPRNIPHQVFIHLSNFSS